MIEANCAYSWRGSAQFCSSSWTCGWLITAGLCGDIASYQFGGGDVGRVYGLPGLLYGGGHFVRLVQAETVEAGPQVGMVPRIIWVVRAVSWGFRAHSRRDVPDQRLIALRVIFSIGPPMWLANLWVKASESRKRWSGLRRGCAEEGLGSAA